MKPDGPFAVTEERARCLAEITTRPTIYFQRFVEQLSFVPTGGQRWVRTMQLQIPQTEAPPEPSWWVVPLGLFARQRLPDIVARDGSGNRISLVTSEQHAVALTKALLTKHLYPEQPGPGVTANGSSPRQRATVGDATNDGQDAHYNDIRQMLHNFHIDDDRERTTSRHAEARGIAKECARLLTERNLAPTTVERRVEKLSADLAEALSTTRYLCWVRATPGEVVHLQTEHSTSDPNHRLEEGSFLDFLKAIWIGVTGIYWHRSGVGGQGRLRLNRYERRKRQVVWYRQYGLAPINYEFNIPTHGYTASYYSTLEAPKHAAIPYVDWEKGDSFEPNSEVTCATPSVHIANSHNSNDNRQGKSDASGVIRAYIRCTPLHHKQILGAAILNMIVVWLLAEGRLPDQLGAPLQGLIVAAPSVLIAYLVQQQRHYYANVLRRSRAILWGYLSIGVIFLVAVAFTNAAVHDGAEKIGSGATAAAWALAISSAALLAWYFPLGHSYDRVIKALTENKLKLITRDPEDEWPLRRFVNNIRRNRWRNSRIEKADKWRCYEAAYEQYSRFIWWLVLTTIVGTTLFLCWRW